MKRIYSILALALCLCGTTALTSCDEDVEISYDLSGEWQGNLGMYYSDGVYEYDAIYSNIRFIPEYEYATHGVGEEIDYFDRSCPIGYQSFYFTWNVSHERIYLHFPHDHSLDCEIYDFAINNNYFHGYFGSSNNYFQLAKLVDYYDWYRYNNGYYYDGYYGYGYTWGDYYGDYYYYYGKERKAPAQQKTTADAAASTAAATADSAAEATEVNPENFTFGRRFNQK